MSKIKVAVLFGGVSSEHEVSCVSATSVLQNIPQDKYDVLMVGITKDGRWLEYTGPAEEIASMAWESQPARRALMSPDRQEHGFLLFDDKGSAELCPVDICFPVLHGKNGEDGSIQGLFQLAGMPFVGCDCISSANCMDKAVTHRLLEAAGIPMARWACVRAEDLADYEALAQSLEKQLGYPMFVKPANAGSSVGVSKAKDRPSLRQALELALKEDKKVIVEEFIDGREIENAVLGNENPTASPACGEIRPLVEFYTYDAKYKDDSTQLLLPAPLSEEELSQLRATAEKAFKTMGCQGLARVDFFLKKDGSGLILNEINTLPGFTSISMYPKLWMNAGLSYSQLLDRLIQLGLERA